jgi:site-specific DNA-methyltransferase (adenine-specific)
VLRPGGAIYVVSGYTHLYDVLAALRATSLVEVNHIIWKYNFGVHTTTKYVSSHYHVLYYAKPGGKRTFNLQARFATSEPGSTGSPNYRDREDVWIVNREYKPGRTKNKNELPHALLQKILAYSSNEGDLVCDFFMGGCSTAAVAIGMNRRFVGFEISPTIFAAAVPPLGALQPGAALAELRRPSPTFVRNRGKAWTPDDVALAIERYRTLAAGGRTKGQIVEQLCAELERGAWSIRKFLKSYAEEVRDVTA